MAQNPNPINRDEKELNKSVDKRVEPDLTSDSYGTKEQKEIVELVMDDLEAGLASQKEWLNVKKLELQHIHAEKPSKIENLKKRSWMSDRNLGIMPGLLDIYQATLLSTCWNPNTFHYVATESNDVDQRDNAAKFTKWGMGKSEANAFPEVDDFIANRVGHGFSMFKVMWEVSYKWVDKRVPKYSRILGRKNRIVSYEIKTEERRFEKGMIRNIDNVDDIIIPSYGKHVQELEFFIERIHTSYAELKRMAKRKIIENFEPEAYLSKLRAAVSQSEGLRAKKLELMNFTEVGTDNLHNMPIDIYEWYGEYEKNGKIEKYRFLIEPITETLFAGKPLRKVQRDGRIPYAGGPLRRVPGLLRGGSLTTLVSNLVNALNNNYNQTSDYQYVENMPFGFANLSEFTAKGVHELEPGVIFDVDEGNIRDNVYFPNLTRSLAWSYQDKEFIMQMIERLTGAASYFLTTDAKQATATRDAIVNEKSETKFGLWVKRIQQDICEAVNMWYALYQESAPRDLGMRVLGEDGEKLFENLSIDDLKGRYDASMIPDITSGSKIYEKQVKLWGLGLTMNSIWFNPQINPRGNWKLTAEAMKANGYPDPEEYMPPMPKDTAGSSDEVKQEFYRMMQGEQFDPPEGATPLVVEHYAGHMKQKEEQYNELPEEYRPVFDTHLFETFVNYTEFIKNKQQEMVANQIAAAAVSNIQKVAGRQEGQENPSGSGKVPLAPGGAPNGSPALEPQGPQGNQGDIPL